MRDFIYRLKSFWYFLITFFPIHLLFLHLRRSFLLNIFWLLLLGFIAGFTAEDYGLRYLFLTPEYLGSISVVSYVLVGVMAGLFIMAFHINSYIYYSYRFPFLATLQRPLWKFSLNNSIIPIFFYGFYVYHLLIFLGENGYGWFDTLKFITALLLGSILVVAFTFGYFVQTIRVLEPNEDKSRKDQLNPLRSVKEIIKPRQKIRSGNTVINYYLRSPFSIKITRSASHYKLEKLLETIEQHHFMASIYFLLLIGITILLSFVGDETIFQIPAAATVFLIFSLYLMVIGAFYSRLKTWTVTVSIVVLISLNFLSGLDQFRTLNYAYGMDYSVEPAPYTYPHLDKITSDSIAELDREQEREVLERWLIKQKGPKPKLVILNLSGGGQRSALWTTKVLSELDKRFENEFFKKVHLICGSSGGMLGGALYREAYFNRHTHQNEFPDINQMIAKDLLNPVCFTLAVNDLFFRLNEVEYNSRSYPLDRGYSFDKQLNINTEGLLSRPLGEYRSFESQAEMPTMILAPSIVGDGRKLLLATRGFSYLCFSRPYLGTHKNKEYDGVEYLRFFKDQDPEGLYFNTALRLSASFPYITPLVNMPSEPEMKLIDAGVRDNEGFELSLRYIFENREWLKQNTSGVVVVQVKANRPDEIPIKDKSATRLDKLVLPISGVVTSFHNLQIYNKGLLMQLSREDLKLPIELVRFSLFEKRDDISLSWHLTESEKKYILNTFETDFNQNALDSLEKYLGY